MFCYQSDMNGLCIFQQKVMLYHKIHQQHSSFDVSVVCLLNILSWAAYSTIKTELNFDHKSVSPKEIRILEMIERAYNITIYIVLILSKKIKFIFPFLLF